MNIDLLIADDNEIGLALDEPFGLEVRVIVFRRCEYTLEARFENGGGMVFNRGIAEEPPKVTNLRLFCPEHLF